MKKVEYVCKKCGSGDFYFSLSERSNTIFEVESGIVKKKDTCYPDRGEINYVKCSKCDAKFEIDEDDFDEVIQNAYELL